MAHQLVVSRNDGLDGTRRLETDNLQMLAGIVRAAAAPHTEILRERWNVTKAGFDTAKSPWSLFPLELAGRAKFDWPLEALWHVLSERNAVGGVNKYESINNGVRIHEVPESGLPCKQEQCMLLHPALVFLTCLPYTCRHILLREEYSGEGSDTGLDKARGAGRFQRTRNGRLL